MPWTLVRSVHFSGKLGMASYFRKQGDSREGCGSQRGQQRGSLAATGRQHGGNTEATRRTRYTEDASLPREGTGARVAPMRQGMTDAATAVRRGISGKFVLKFFEGCGWVFLLRNIVFCNVKHRKAYKKVSL